MNVLRSPRHVGLTQSAETCLGDIGAAVGLVSLLPLEITGCQESKVVSPVKVKVSDSPAWDFGGQFLLLGTWVSNFRQLIFVCSLSSTAPQTLMNVSLVGSAQGKVSVFGSIRWQTGGVNLLWSVSYAHSFPCLDRGFNFYLPDVDECASPRSCPEHSTCQNSLGSYSCVCNPGYVSRSGKKSFQGTGETCQGRCRGLLGIMSNLFGKTAVLEEEFEVEVGLG